jgi:hypothetical protein
MKQFSIFIFGLVLVAPLTALAWSGQCQIKTTDAQGKVQQIGTFKLTALNPDGHYGLLMKGAGYGFSVLLITNICTDDGGCNWNEAGTSAEKISVGISSFEGNASQQIVISGHTFALGDPVTSRLNVGSTSIDCTLQYK